MRLAKAATIGLALALVPSAALAGHGTSGGSGLSFTNTRLSTSDGGSEPAITIGKDGTLIAGALSWKLFQTNLWKGPFGSTPLFQGAPDASLEPGVGGGGDEDWDLASNGTLHGTTLIFFFNPQTRIRQLGVSAISCPNADTSNNFANCSSRVIDTTQADRQWVTSLGSTVWISYHDSGNSSLIHVQRSTDDGNTWTTVGRPIPGQGAATGDATFNNAQGPIVADPATGDLFDVYAAGEPGIQKGTTATFNNIFVSRSTDDGKTWASK